MAAMAHGPETGKRGETIFTAIALLFPGWLTGTLMFRRRINPRLRLLSILLLLGFVGGITACGGSTPNSSGNTPSTPAGTSTVQVTLTGSGGLSQAIKLGRVNTI
jgi:hypothetical protein